MGQNLFPNEGVWTFAQLAAAIPLAPSALGIHDIATLRGVVMCDQHGNWTPFAMRFEIGAINRTRKGLITAGDLILFDIEAPAHDLGTKESLTAFLQSWREYVPKPVARGTLQDMIQIRRQPSERSFPCWQFSFYERLDETSQGIVPVGPFSSVEASFLATSAGDAATQWLQDESLTEYSSIRAGIESRVWDPRAFLSKVTREENTIEVTIASSSPVPLACTILFRIGSRSETKTEKVINLTTLTFAIPKNAERCNVYLIGMDNFCYDQRFIWVQAPQKFVFPPEEVPVEKKKTIHPSQAKRPGGQTNRRSRVDFVDRGRISQLEAVRSADFDLKKLVRLCEELNQSWRSDSFIAIAVLTRTILDHIPPLFGKQKFVEVVENYSGGKSFRDSMKHLEESARKIADGHLHSPIRKKESLPNRTQVDFSRDLDVLLAEIVRHLGSD